MSYDNYGDDGDNDGSDDDYNDGSENSSLFFAKRECFVLSIFLGMIICLVFCKNDPAKSWFTNMCDCNLGLFLCYHDCMGLICACLSHQFWCHFLLLS